MLILAFFYEAMDFINGIKEVEVINNYNDEDEGYITLYDKYGMINEIEIEIESIKGEINEIMDNVDKCDDIIEFYSRCLYKLQFIISIRFKQFKTWNEVYDNSGYRLNGIYQIINELFVDKFKGKSENGIGNLNTDLSKRMWNKSVLKWGKIISNFVVTDEGRDDVLQIGKFCEFLRIEMDSVLDGIFLKVLKNLYGKILRSGEKGIFIKLAEYETRATRIYNDMFPEGIFFHSRAFNELCDISQEEFKTLIYFEFVNDYKINEQYKISGDRKWNIYDDWPVVFKKYIKDTIDSIEINEKSLKSVVEFIEKFIFEVDRLKNKIKIDKIDVIKETTGHVNNKIKKDLSMHYLHYINYKIKNIIKYNNRNLMEKELRKLTEGVMLMKQILGYNKVNIMETRYESLLFNRMIEVMKNRNEILEVNWMDCEIEMIKSFGYNKDILREIKNSKNLKEGWDKCNEREFDDIILIFKYNNNFDNYNIWNRKGNNRMKLNLKLRNEIKKFYRRNFNHLESNKRKIIFKIDYFNSIMEVKYGEDCQIECNSYEGMILENLDDGMKEVDIVNKLDIEMEIVKRSIDRLIKSKVILRGNDGSLNVNEGLTGFIVVK